MRATATDRVRGLVRGNATARRVAASARRARWRAFDSRRVAEQAGARVVFDHLPRIGFLAAGRGGRILEIGPKHGEDSLLLPGLEPRELVLIDLASKRDVVETWLDAVRKRCPVSYVEGNLLYMPLGDLESLGRFDIV